MNKRELAKFFSGYAVAKVLFHGALAYNNALPLELFGFTLTPNCNFWIMIIWGAAAAFLIHYAWFKR